MDLELFAEVRSQFPEHPLKELAIFFTGEMARGISLGVDPFSIKGPNWAVKYRSAIKRAEIQAKNDRLNNMTESVRRGKCADHTTPFPTHGHPATLRRIEQAIKRGEILALASLAKKGQ